MSLSCWSSSLCSFKHLCCWWSILSCDIQVNSLTQSQIISHIYANSNNLCYACPHEGTAGQNPPGWRNFCGMLILLLWVHLFSRPSKKGPLCPGCLLGRGRWSLVSLTFAWANGLLSSFLSQARRKTPEIIQNALVYLRLTKGSFHRISSSAWRFGIRSGKYLY